MCELVPNRGSNYEELISYQKTDVIFQITYYCLRMKRRNPGIPDDFKEPEK